MTVKAIAARHIGDDLFVIVAEKDGVRKEFSMRGKHMQELRTDPARPGTVRDHLTGLGEAVLWNKWNSGKEPSDVDYALADARHLSATT